MTTNTNTIINPITIKELQKAIKEMQAKLSILMQQPCNDCGSCTKHDCICLDEDEG